MYDSTPRLRGMGEGEGVEIKEGLIYFFHFLIVKNCLLLSLMFNISQILNLFLQLEILESKKVRYPKKTAKESGSAESHRECC